MLGQIYLKEIKMRERPLIAVSGGFDPVHIGHIRMIRDAARYGDVMVIINSDDWLQRKKGYVFMPYEQRAEMSKKHGEEYHVDHIIPLSIGGAHHQDNMRVITAKENLEKRDKYIPELGGVWADNDLARETKKKLGIK